MTREKFVTIHQNRGYSVTEFGKAVVIEKDNYRAIWFFHPDGSVDEKHPPMWKVTS